MNHQLKSAFESMLDPEQNGWAFNEEQRDCARIMLGITPCEALSGLGLTSGDILAFSPKGNEWNYALAQAPVGHKIQVSAKTKSGASVYTACKERDGTWRSWNGGMASGVYAWRHFAKDDPAPLPEGD
jgi:hypothetical protein